MKSEVVREVSRCRAGAEHSTELRLGFPYCSTLPPPGELELCMLAAQVRLPGLHRRQQGAPLLRPAVREQRGFCRSLEGRSAGEGLLRS